MNAVTSEIHGIVSSIIWILKNFDKSEMAIFDPILTKFKINQDWLVNNSHTHYI